MIGIIYGILFYLAALILFIGLGYRIWIYSKTPSPLKIPTTPAPTTKTGVVGRQAKEVLFFASLFRSSKWTWLFGWLFHVALAIVTIRHLRYFTEPVWSWVVFVQPIGVYAGILMVVALAGLWVRRFAVDRVRYISSLSDHLMLALLIAIGMSGLGMKYLAHTDIVSFKTYMLGLMSFNMQPLPADPLLLIHLGLVISLMIIFPFSKLLHAPGVFFSPSRHQVDNARDKRHLAGWAEALESNKEVGS